MAFTERENRLIKEIRDYRVPPEGGVSVSDLDVIIRNSRISRDEYSLIAIAMDSFNYRFMMGQKYEKNRLSRKTPESL